MAFLYSDEDFPFATVVELRSLGHNVLTALQAGQANQRIPDPDVLRHAIGLGRAVLTFNRRHFIRLHRQTPSHCGIVVCTKDDDFASLARRIDRAVTKALPLDGKLIRVNKLPNP